MNNIQHLYHLKKKSANVSCISDKEINNYIKTSNGIGNDDHIAKLD